MADLAKACQTSKSLIYHYFPSKDDILYAVMAEHLDALTEAAETACASGSADEKLRALTVAFMRLYASAQNHHKVLLNELDNLPPGAAAEVVAKQRRIIAAAESVIAEIAPGRRRAGEHDAVLRHDQLDPHLVRSRPARSCRRRWRCAWSRSCSAGVTPQAS